MPLASGNIRSVHLEQMSSALGYVCEIAVAVKSYVQTKAFICYIESGMGLFRSRLCLLAIMISLDTGLMPAERVAQGRWTAAQTRAIPS